jgi:hypothetical protein
MSRNESVTHCPRCRSVRPQRFIHLLCLGCRRRSTLQHRRKFEGREGQYEESRKRRAEYYRGQVEVYGHIVRWGDPPDTGGVPGGPKEGQHGRDTGGNKGP